MNRNDTVQLSYRLNLKNPDHLLVYRTLRDLNPEIHKSMSSFAIDCMIQVITGTAPEQLTLKGKEEAEDKNESDIKNELNRLRDEVHSLKDSIAREVMNQVMQEILKSILSPAAFNIPKADLSVPVENEPTHSLDEQTEQALSDLTDLWS